MGRIPARLAARDHQLSFQGFLVAPLALACAVAASASGGGLQLGRSWQGRPIEAFEVGNPAGTRVLVVGSIHGNETGGMAVARALERLAPRGLDLWIVPDLNPDGAAAGTRRNAHGVDLNRNFPWHWRPLRRGLRLRPAPALGTRGPDRKGPDPPAAAPSDGLVPPAPRPGLGLRRQPASRASVRAHFRAALPPDAATRRERDLVAEQHAARDDRVRGRAAGRRAGTESGRPLRARRSRGGADAWD